jgi:hypothetical protein
MGLDVKAYIAISIKECAFSISLMIASDAPPLGEKYTEIWVLFMFIVLAPEGLEEQENINILKMTISIGVK